VRDLRRTIIVACVRGAINVQQGETLMDLAEEIQRQCPRKFERAVMSEAQVAALHSKTDEHRDNLD
jgi:hypothetical protein